MAYRSSFRPPGDSRKRAEANMKIRGRSAGSQSGFAYTACLDSIADISLLAWPPLVIPDSE
jgi:hypothetical protein